MSPAARMQIVGERPPAPLAAALWFSLLLVAIVLPTLGLLQLRVDPVQGADAAHLWSWFGIPTLISWSILSLWALRQRLGKHVITTPALVALLLVALGARVLLACLTAPQLSDDIYRYLLDGQTLAVGDNPYRRAPAEIKPLTAADSELLSRINHPELVTIYQPTSQYVFSLLAKLDPTPRGFRLGFIIHEALLVLLLLWTLQRDGNPRWPILLYALHPLALAEIASSGHQDLIGILPLLAALVLATDPHSNAGPGHLPSLFRAALAGVCFALALACKPLVAPLALPLLWHWRRRPAPAAVAALACLLMLGLLYTPFTHMMGGLDRMQQTVSTFMADWSFNATLHPLLRHLGAPGSGASAVCAGVVLVILLWRTWRNDDLLRTAMEYLLAALLLSSTVYPWYLLWALALLPLRFNLALWVFSLTINSGYLVWTHPEHWRVSSAVVIATHVPVLLALTLRRRQAVLPSGIRVLDPTEAADNRSLR